MRFLGYACIERIKKKRVLALKWEARSGRREGDFPEKNFWEQKIQNSVRAQLRLAPPRHRGGSPPPLYNGVLLCLLPCDSLERCKMYKSTRRKFGSLKTALKTA